MHTCMGMDPYMDEYLDGYSINIPISVLSNIVFLPGYIILITRVNLPGKITWVKIYPGISKKTRYR